CSVLQGEGPLDTAWTGLRLNCSRHDQCIPDGRLHTRVQIARDVYRDLVAWYEQQACRKSVEELSRELWNLPYEPYAPVRRQFLNLLRIINQHRRTAGQPAVPLDCLRLRRKIVRVFGSETVT
ncbi:MAG: hypothetical protein ACKPHU_23575, partial [Planctomycetaceae bacterium]